MPTDDEWQALWYHKSTVTRSMLATTDSHLRAQKGKETEARRLWEQRGRYFVSARLRLNTASVSVVALDNPALGSLWVPFHPYGNPEVTGSAICLWFNSTAGVLATMGGRGNRILSRPDFSIDAQKSLPVPKFELFEGSLEAMASAFEELKHETLLSFPQIDTDPVRRQIDDAVTNALGLDPEWVAAIRRELSREPSITNQRYIGLE